MPHCAAVDRANPQGERDGIWRMQGRRLVAFLSGIVAAAVILAALFLVVGGERVLAALASADRRLVAATFGVGLCWLFAWSLMLRAVLGTLGVDVPVVRSFLVYAGAVFANNVTPFGQAGGEPFAALLVSRASGARYETGLAGVASVDVVNVVPSISLLLVGVGYYATTAAVGEHGASAASDVGVAAVGPSGAASASEVGSTSVGPEGGAAASNAANSTTVDVAERRASREEPVQGGTEREPTASERGRE